MPTRKTITREQVEGMTASEINRAMDRIERESSALTDAMIEAGRGNERPSETVKKSDPLATRFVEIENDRALLRGEIERRYGPGAPRRLPPGFRAKRSADERELRRRAIRLAYERPEMRTDILNMLRTAEFKASLTYVQWLEDREYKVTPEQAAFHSHMVDDAEPLAKNLHEFVRNYAMSYTMTAEESETLSNAARILKTLLVSPNSLKIEEKRRPTPPRTPR